MKERQKYIIENKKEVFFLGMKYGIPIALGYLAVSFSLGVAAQAAGLSPFQGFLASILCHASAGEYVGFTAIAASAAFFETAVLTLVANARYLLMSCAMSQRLSPKLPLHHRLFMAFYLTDEIFGISIARPGYLHPYFTYGAASIASPAWAVGTALGVIAGSLLPVRLVSAFSVALFGMFLAVIIPPAKKNRVVAGLIIICFIASYFSGMIPGFASLSEGIRTIILTVAISAAAALLFPRRETDEEEQHD